MFNKPAVLVAYTFVVIIISALITTGYFHVFVLGNTSGPQQQAITLVSEQQQAASPIKENNAIIEVFSYGCHYCAINERNVAGLEAQMPVGSKFIRIHLANPQFSGLASYAQIFATLSVMGVEPLHRESLYKAVLKDNVDLADEKALDAWLQQNAVDKQAYQRASGSDEAKALLNYMMEISRHYQIKATPTFIVNKKWLALQDGDFDKFSAQLMSLLEQDKPLEN